MKDRFASSLTTIDAFWRYDSQQEARLIEEGDGSNRAGIEAKAYVKKGSNDIWGEAGYDFGQRRNVMLNESSDYQTDILMSLPTLSAATSTRRTTDSAVALRTH